MDEKTTDLAAENATLKAKIAKLEAEGKQRAEDEKAIGEKMSRGLTRAQAIAVIGRQKKFDAEKGKPTKKTK